MTAVSQKRTWWTVLAVLGLAAGLLAGGPGLAGAQAGEATPVARAGGQLPEGQVWAVPLVLPWDEQAVKSADWSQFLDRKLDLTRKGKAGETRWYEFRRENLMYARIGTPMNRMVAQGRVKRTLQREEQPGWWRERVEWTSFSVAQTQGATDAPAVQEIPGARGIGFDFFPKQFDYVNIPADFSGTGNDLSGYLMKVASMDTMGFDAIAMSVREASKDAVQIGQTTRMARWQESTHIGQVTKEGEAGQYRLGEMAVSVAGITRRNGEPCLVVWFQVDSSDVKQDVSSEQMTMRMHGTEYFRGEMAVSLLDGHVVAGELFGPLPWVMEMGFGGQPPKEQPIAGVIQQVSLWEVPAPHGENSTGQ